MRMPRIGKLLPNVLTVAVVGAITVADINAAGGIPWYKALAWCAVWIVVLAIICSTTDRRR